MGPVRGFLSTAQPGRGGATVAGLAVGMSVRLQLVGKQMGGYRVHPMHAECIAGNGRFFTRRRALGAADRAERRLRRVRQRQLQAAIGALWQGGGWVGACSGFFAGWGVGGWVGIEGFLEPLLSGAAKKQNPGAIFYCR